MKNVTVILFIVLLTAAGLGLVAYTKNQKKAETAMTAMTSATQPSEVSQTPTPTPNVQQISLSVSAPASGTTVTSPTVVIKGKTLPKADVFVNDTQVTADAQGNFSATITLDEGENTIVIAANDADGNSSEQELMITYDSGQ